MVWELTADSLSTLKPSFKELADALARTSEQQALWRHIQSMPQGEAKDKKTLAFVKAVLQKESNWLLIYDNVEALSDMKEYMPLDADAWGRGHVLITTCNANLQHAGLSLRHARTLTYLGNAYRLSGIYGKAGAVLEQSLSIYQKHPKQAHEIAQPRGVLSTVYRDMGEYTKAIQMMEDSLKLFKDHETFPMWWIGVQLCLGSTYTIITPENQTSRQRRGLNVNYGKEQSKWDIK